MDPKALARCCGLESPPARINRKRRPSGVYPYLATDLPTFVDVISFRPTLHNSLIWHWNRNMLGSFPIG
jgi:hypothetical protein